MYEIFEEIIAKKNLKVADVVKGTGIRHGVFTDWKMGRYTPKADKLQVIADFLDIPLEYLIGKEKESVDTDPFTLKMMEIAKNATPEQKKMILQIADTVLQAK